MRDHAHDRLREQQAAAEALPDYLKPAPKPERRPVQIAAASDQVTDSLYVLASDQTLWLWGFGKWIALPALPQPEEPKP